MLLWRLGCMHLFELVFSFYLDVYPWDKLLDNKVILFLVFFFFFMETPYCSTNGGSPIYITSNSVQGLFVVSLMTAIFKCIRWYLIVVLICSSLMTSHGNIFPCMYWPSVCSRKIRSWEFLLWCSRNKSD